MELVNSTQMTTASKSSTGPLKTRNTNNVASLNKILMKELSTINISLAMPTPYSAL